MRIVEIPKTGWKKLDWIVGQFADMINQRTAIAGKGIEITEKPTGVIIGLKELGDSQDGGDYYWVTLYGVTMKKVTVVDPQTCAQSKLIVYIREPRKALKFQAKIVPGGPPQMEASNESILNE